MVEAIEPTVQARFRNWRRTGQREELLRAGIVGAVLVLAVTNHRAAIVPLVVLLALFAWRREHVDFAIEGSSVHIRLKYQGIRFDLAFLPPSPEAGAGELGADETRLLVVLRGVTAELADEVETMPPLVCALRIETLLERVDADRG